MFSQVCNAVEYLHSRSVAHRDLKLENCFIGSDFAVKIGDMGMIKVFGTGEALST
jgi:serine/threonine protein kinase